MRFIRFGIRDRIIRFFYHPDKTHSAAFEVPFYGLRYTGRFDSFIDWSIYYYGSYSGQELRLIQDLARFQHDTFVDIGANVGQHSLFASLYFDRVVAIEPFENVYTQLQQNLDANHLSHVTLLKYGLGIHNEVVPFFPPETNNLGTGSFLRTRSQGEAVALKLRNGDEVFSEEAINGNALIKIDTEGFEPFVFEGLVKYLKNSKPIIFFEWSQNGHPDYTFNPNNPSLPKEYICYQFIEHIPYLLVFERINYRLRRLNTKWPNGMILAIHQDYFNQPDFTRFIKAREIR